MLPSIFCWFIVLCSRDGVTDHRRNPARGSAVIGSGPLRDDAGSILAITAVRPAPLLLSSPSNTRCRDDEAGAQLAYTKRQVFALLTFVSHAVKSLTSSPSSSLTGTPTDTALLTVLLDIGVSKAGPLAEASMSNVSQAASAIITDALLAMPASQFVHGVVTALESGVPAVCSHLQLGNFGHL